MLEASLRLHRAKPSKLLCDYKNTAYMIASMKSALDRQQSRKRHQRSKSDFTYKCLSRCFDTISHVKVNVSGNTDVNISIENLELAPQKEH